MRSGVLHRGEWIIPEPAKTTSHLRRFLRLLAATGVGAAALLLVSEYLPAIQTWRDPVCFLNWISSGLFALFAITRYSTERTARRLLLGAAYASTLIITMVQVWSRWTDTVQTAHTRALWLAVFAFASSHPAVAHRTVPGGIAAASVAAVILLGRGWAAIDLGVVEAWLGKAAPLAPALAALLFFCASYQHASQRGVLDVGLAVAFSLYGWSTGLVILNPLQPAALSCAFLIDSLATLCLLLSAGWDVMDLLRVEREAADRNRRSRLVIDRIPCAFLLLDARGAVSLCNPASERLLGVRREDVLGKPYSELAAHLPREMGLVGDVLVGGAEYHDVEVRIQSPSGPRYWSLTARPLGNDSGRPGGAVVVIEDVTERRQLAERIEAGERLASIGGLAASIAHEIRNPLTAIKGLLHLAEPVSTRGEASCIRACVDLIDEIEMVVSQVLSLVRPRVPVLCAIQPAFLVESVLADALGQFASRGIRWKCDVKGPSVVTDPEAFRHALLSVIGSIGGSLPNDACVSATMIPADERGLVTLRIDFPGVGLAADSADAVFDPAFVLGSAHIGFGLCVGKKLIEESGGRVEAVACGDGLTLEIQIPPAAEEAKGKEDGVAR